MEKIDIYLSNNRFVFIKDILSFFNLSLTNLFLFLLYIFLIILIKYFIKMVKKPLRYWLFINRKKGYYKFLFYRVDNILEPFSYLVYITLLTFAILNIFNIESGSTFDIVIYVIKLSLILWFVYEIIKFFIYSAIRNKIKSQKSARRELFSLLLNISKIIIAIIAVVSILSKFNVDITALITSLGIGGVIIGFSAKDVLVNFFDSIRLISEDAFRQGDWIETKEIEGLVTELGLTSTQIRTFDNAMVTVPNSKLANDYIKNWTKRLVGRRIKFNIPIKYTSNTEEIDRVVDSIYKFMHTHSEIVNLEKIKYLKKRKLTHEDGLFNIDDKYGVRKTLVVQLEDMGLYSLNILIYAFSISVDYEEWLRVKQDVIKNIIKIIENSKLEFAYPTQEIRLLK